MHVWWRGRANAGHNGAQEPCAACTVWMGARARKGRARRSPQPPAPTCAAASCCSPPAPSPPPSSSAIVPGWSEARCRPCCCGMWGAGAWAAAAPSCALKLSRLKLELNLLLLRE